MYNRLRWGLICFALAGCRAHKTTRQFPGGLSLLAGALGGAGSVDGAGADARFNLPTGIAVDSSGNVYVGDHGNDTIRKISGDGTVTTLAGEPGYPGSADGTGGAAGFSGLSGIAVDSSGTVYVADRANHTIRKVSPAGIVTTLAGAAGQQGSSDGTGAAASFAFPEGVAVDAAGTVYVADTVNDTIRRVSSEGVVTTLAGVAGQQGSSDGTGSGAMLNSPSAVATDSAGNIYVADEGNNAIRRVTPTGVVTTLASGTVGAAVIVGPRGVAVDSSGTVYFTDGQSAVRMITLGGIVTLAGSNGLQGSADGTGGAARFFFPVGLALDAAGNTFVADTYNCTIRRVTAGAVVTTVAGSPGQAGTTDATGSVARFTEPLGIAEDASGDLYVADSQNGEVRRVTSAGVVTTVAGGMGQLGSADGTGSAARFAFPTGLAVDASGNVYISDPGYNTIRQMTSTGVVTTLAGNAGSPGSTDGTGPSARFSDPLGLAVDGAGNVYVADSGNDALRKVSPEGVVTTMAGAAGLSGSTDGAGSMARFDQPSGVAISVSGDVYVVDSGNDTIRVVTPAGDVTTLAGAPQVAGSADGKGEAARFNNPTGIVVDTSGNLYVADSGNATVRKLTPAGVVTTVVGAPGQAAVVLGELPGELSRPYGLALLGPDTLAISDANENAILVAQF
jgi:sugar lactone lactonase YvrE